MGSEKGEEEGGEKHVHFQRSDQKAIMGGNRKRLSHQMKH